jgi:hypothetical protein
VAGFTVFLRICGQCSRSVLEGAKKMGRRFETWRPISRNSVYFSVKVRATGALMVGANVRVVGKFGGVTAPFMKRLS